MRTPWPLNKQSRKLRIRHTKNLKYIYQYLLIHIFQNLKYVYQNLKYIYRRDLIFDSPLALVMSWRESIVRDKYPVAAGQAVPEAPAVPGAVAPCQVPVSGRGVKV